MLMSTHLKDVDLEFPVKNILLNLSIFFQMHHYQLKGSQQYKSKNFPSNLPLMHHKENIHIHK